MAQTEITPVIGYITPMASTRLRIEPSTYTTVKGTFPAGSIVEVDQTILYLENDAVQPAIQKGDLWGRVVKIAGTPISQPAFMAIDYHGEAICTKHYIPTAPPPPATIPYPDFILVGPAGLKRTYTWDESIPLQ